VHIVLLLFYSNIIQEGWLLPTERASVSAISLRQNLVTSRESRRYVVAFTRFAGGGKRESKTHFGLPWVRHSDNRGKCSRLERGYNACKMPRCIVHIPIYLQPFPRYSKLLVENYDIFISHLCLAALQGVTPSEFREDLDIHKTRMNVW